MRAVEYLRRFDTCGALDLALFQGVGVWASSRFGSEGFLLILECRNFYRLGLVFAAILFVTAVLTA